MAAKAGNNAEDSSEVSDGLDSDEAKKLRYENEHKLIEFLYQFEDYKIDLTKTI